MSTPRRTNGESLEALTAAVEDLSKLVEDQNKRLATERATTAGLQAAVDLSETARQAEREQCAADFAGEVERGRAHWKGISK
jgi:hypothetical protein